MPSSLPWTHRSPKANAFRGVAWPCKHVMNTLPESFLGLWLFLAQDSESAVCPLSM